MRQKVLLIHPSDDTNLAIYPLSCLYLAAFLKRDGYEPIILDHNDEKDYKGFLSPHLNDAICVGISSLTGTQIRYGLEISKWIKSINPKLPIVWGGHHPTACPEQTVSDPRVDIIVAHEGELTFLELVKTLEKGGTLREVKGISYKDDGRVVTNPYRPPMDLSVMPDIPWHLIDIERKLKKSIDKSISIQTGRGCPFSCTFCSHEKTGLERYRMFNADYILNNIEPVIRRYGIKEVNFFEPLFIANKERLKEICRKIKNRGLNIEWTASARADSFSKFDGEILLLLKESGCKLLTFGFESGSPETLHKINKKTRVEHAIKSATLCSEYSIQADACFIVGFPFESVSDILQTMSLVSKIRHINPGLTLHVQTYTAFPGTILYKECIKRYGLKAVQSLEEWGELLWLDDRPWLKGWKRHFTKSLRSSIYASSLNYLLRKRKDIWFRRPLHYSLVTIFELIYFFSKIRSSGA